MEDSRWRESGEALGWTDVCIQVQGPTSWLDDLEQDTDPVAELVSWSL